MTVVARGLSQGFLAVAVLLAGMCCTPGLCLLGVFSMHPQVSSSRHVQHDTSADVPVCCMQHQHASSAPQPGRSCPLCRQSVVLAKGVDHDSGALPAVAAVDYFLPPIELLPLVSRTCSRLADNAKLPAEIPHTLLGLHCALIG
jgi:hypothetical protein